MAEYINYTPTTIASKALVNWDEFGVSDFKYLGIINVSISNCFTYDEYIASNRAYEFNYSYTNPVPLRNSSQLSNIDFITNQLSYFANLKFNNVVDYANKNPAQVGSLSDINISFISMNDYPYAGISCGNFDYIFGYDYARGDITLNAVSGYSTSLSIFSELGNTLMHELGHSLGLSHPQIGYDSSGNYIYSNDFNATVNLGFSKLGFNINSAADMDKQYFTMMSYDQQYVGITMVASITPMILDIMALQDIYGSGTGTSSAGDSTIYIGSNGAVDSYRSYYDLGGIDTINLSNYVSGAYLNMGTTIVGASHLVGVSMSLSEWQAMTTSGTDPSSLRWFYGEFENATGSTGNDKIIGNSLDNSIISGSGNDILQGGLGNDTLDGGLGNDVAIFSGSYNSYRISHSGNSLIVTGVDGKDTVTNVEYLTFTGSDTTLATASLPSFKSQLTQNDFNGDGTSDVLWRNPSNNLIGLWSVNHGNYSWNLVGQVSTNLVLAGMGDFNGDGTMDVLWQNTTTNAMSIWSMHNGAATFTNLSTGSTTMKVAAIGDFNGDGTSDVLWQNPTNNLIGVWSMKNGSPTWALIGSGSSTMKVAGVGDFNGDGTTDVLWINPTNNLIGVWSMSSNHSSWDLIGQGSTTMNIAGIGDFNGDGTSDILWQNSANNLIGVWSMNNNVSSWSLLGQGSTTMNIAAIGDYNGDGTSDIMWQNPTNNLLGTWTISSNSHTWALMGQGSTTMKIA